MSAIVRLIRRTCLLREQGEARAAAALQAGELAAAIAGYREAAGPDSLTEDKLCALFLSESEHVAEAVVLAELLAPQLARLLPAADPDRVPLFAPLPESVPAARRLPGEAPAITDLLDAMLAAERPGRRPAPAHPRQF